MNKRSFKNVQSQCSVWLCSNCYFATLEYRWQRSLCKRAWRWDSNVQDFVNTAISSSSTQSSNENGLLHKTIEEDVNKKLHVDRKDAICSGFDVVISFYSILYIKKIVSSRSSRCLWKKPMQNWYGLSKEMDELRRSTKVLTCCARCKTKIVVLKCLAHLFSVFLCSFLFGSVVLFISSVLKSFLSLWVIEGSSQLRKYKTFRAIAGFWTPFHRFCFLVQLVKISESVRIASNKEALTILLVCEICLSLFYFATNRLQWCEQWPWNVSSILEGLVWAASTIIIQLASSRLFIHVEMPPYFPFGWPIPRYIDVDLLKLLFFYP